MFDSLSISFVVYSIITILISLTIHEFMHAYAGFLLGDDTASKAGRISFNPLDHIDPVMTIGLPIITLLLFHAPILAAKPVPFNPVRVKWDEFGSALISFAGPASNFVLALVGAIVLNAVPGNSVLVNFLIVFIKLNVAIFVFNLIPIPPLDGSRVLYAFAPEPVQRFFDSIEPIGFYIIIGLVVLGGLGGFLSDLNQAVVNILP